MRRQTLAMAMVVFAGVAFGAPHLTGPPVSELTWGRLFARGSASPSARTLRPAPVHLPVSGYWSWAMIDRRTGELAGASNLASQTDTASMIKAWTAADYLRQNAASVDASQLQQLSVMIRDSDNDLATHFDSVNGGASSIERLAVTCGLSETQSDRSGRWSTTLMSARDAARMGVCIADGRAAGPQWTSWLMNEMRHVRGEGRFGIVQALPPDVAHTVSIKNGWVMRNDGKWHVTCLGITGEWSLSVMSVYAGRLGSQYGASICQEVAEQLGV